MKILIIGGVGFIEGHIRSDDAVLGLDNFRNGKQGGGCDAKK